MMISDFCSMKNEKSDHLRVLAGEEHRSKRHISTNPSIPGLAG